MIDLNYQKPEKKNERDEIKLLIVVMFPVIMGLLFLTEAML